MHVIASADGRRRIWYREDEIERLATGQLQAAGLLPTASEPRVDIEALVERHLGAVVDYGVPLPPELLGFTEFTRPPRVGISRALTDAATRPDAPLSLVGRWRATLAHEAAHVMLHAPLYAPPEAQPGLPHVLPIRCSRPAVDGAAGDVIRIRDWREVQANKGMAALLMPKQLFEPRAMAAFEARRRFLPALPAAHHDVEPVVRFLAALFEVSQASARIRLMTLGFVAAP